MTKDELLKRLNGIEWNDFEIKEAKNEVPKTAWETVSAFSNSFGGWIVFGVKEKRSEGKSTYEIQGVDQPEKIEQDFNTRLYCVREALVNMLAHADYFSEIHSTIRAFDTSIQFQNPGSFPVNLKILGQTIVSQPRNPNILRFFKLARLSENGGYGIDKILNWKELTGCAVTIDSDITKSEVRFELPINVNQRQSTPKSTPKSTPNGVNDVNSPLAIAVMALIVANNSISIAEIASSTGKSRRNIDRVIESLKKLGKLTRVGSARSGSWKVCE